MMRTGSAPPVLLGVAAGAGFAAGVHASSAPSARQYGCIALHSLRRIRHPFESVALARFRIPAGSDTQVEDVHAQPAPGDALALFGPEALGQIGFKARHLAGERPQTFEHGVLWLTGSRRRLEPGTHLGDADERGVGRLRVLGSR